MSDSFRDRLKRLHDAHQRGRHGDDGPEGVYRADESPTDDESNAEEDPPNRLGGWEGLGAKRCATHKQPLWIIETRCDADLVHGRWTLEQCHAIAHHELSRLDRQAPADLSPDDLLYMDIETTGLGPNAYAFMVGVGFWENDQFIVEQLVIDGPDDEPALLEGFAKRIHSARCLVTFNGKRFDTPLLQRRYEHHGLRDPFQNCAHLDLLPVARRVFPGLNRYKLALLEQYVLDLERIDDVPGREIPTRWGQFQRNKNPSIMEKVVEHNRLDIISMVALVAAAVTNDDPQARREAAENKQSRALSWTLPHSMPEGAGEVAGKLMRSYRLRGKFSRRDRHASDAPPSESASAPAPGESTASPAPPQPATDRRIQELKTACQGLIEQDMWREAFPMLCQLVALSPRTKWGLKTLAEYYRREGREELAREIDRRPR